MGQRFYEGDLINFRQVNDTSTMFCFYEATVVGGSSEMWLFLMQKRRYTIGKISTISNFLKLTINTSQWNCGSANKTFTFGRLIITD